MISRFYIDILISSVQNSVFEPKLNGFLETLIEVLY